MTSAFSGQNVINQKCIVHQNFASAHLSCQNRIVGVILQFVVSDHSLITQVSWLNTGEGAGQYGFKLCVLLIFR